MSDVDKNDRFFRSEYSGGGNCVEFRVRPDGRVTVRHSRDRERELVFSSGEWDAFVRGVKDARFDAV